VTCGKAQGFLAQKKVETAELVDAKKARLGLEDALAMLKEADLLVAARGKKVERVDLTAGKPDKATVERLMLGPTGNLRAPTLRVGRTILVGFDEETYRKTLG
jgi:arsenate reductase-like glutaredoxin family protein